MLLPARRVAPRALLCSCPALDQLQVTGMVASQLELHRYATGTQSRVITSMTLLKSHLFKCAGPPVPPLPPHTPERALCHAAEGSAGAVPKRRAACSGHSRLAALPRSSAALPFVSCQPCKRAHSSRSPPAPRDRYQGHVSAALVLGGVDFRGPHLFTVYPHGSTDSLPFCTMGSGRCVGRAAGGGCCACTHAGHSWASRSPAGPSACAPACVSPCDLPPSPVCRSPNAAAALCKSCHPGAFRLTICPGSTGYNRIQPVPALRHAAALPAS
mgnify:CR=1 FL=1